MRFIERFLTWIGLWACRWLAFGPRPLLRAVAWLVGNLAFATARHRRHVALTNLRLCFPQWDESRRRVVVRRHMVLYARAFLERFEIWFGDAQRLRRQVRIVDMEHLVAHDGRPVILLAPHFVGLDAGGVRFQLERRFASVFAHQSNSMLDEWTLRGRSRFNDPLIISRQQGMTSIARCLKRGVPIYFLPDMDLGPRDAVLAPFFGVPAATVTSVVRLSRMMDAVVVPLVTRMTDEGYEARFYPGWTHASDGGEESLVEGVTRMNRFIEQRILEMPEQYLWTHRRFKTRPPGEPSVYG
jgi:KDO2-lipid IV(A) lauroyltransferase